MTTTSLRGKRVKFAQSPFMKVMRFIGALLTIALIGVLVALNWPQALGGRGSWVIVSGTSMEPTFHTGDMVVAWKTDDYQVGDLIVYTMGGNRGLVIHRIIEGNPVDGWITLGDNKPRPDPWVVPQGNIIGEEVFSVPQLGTAFAYIRTPAFLAAAAGIFVFWAIVTQPGKKRRLERHRVFEPALVAGMPATVRDVHEAGARFIVESPEPIEPESQVPIDVWVNAADGSRSIASGLLTVRYDYTRDEEGRAVGGPVDWSTETDVNKVLGHVTGYVLVEDDQVPKARAAEYKKLKKKQAKEARKAKQETGSRS